MFYKVAMAVAFGLGASVVALPEGVQYDHMQPRSVMSAQDILAKGITASGGEDAILAIKGVSSNA